MDGPCVEAEGHRIAGGYGRKRRGGVRKLAHVWAWEDANGPVPVGMFVLHRCDNPPCVNVDHLFLGTLADNNRDRHVKGRDVVPDQRGEAHSQARLTDEAIREIRQLVCSMTNAAVARLFSVSPSVISRVKNGKTWSHVV